MTAKIVCRLMDAGGGMLGWVEHWAVMRGDGLLRSAYITSILVDTYGWATQVSLHWCDAHVETRVPLPSMLSVRPGDCVQIFDMGVPMIRIGDTPGALPPVTVGTPVSIAVPVGTMGAQGNA